MPSTGPSTYQLLSKYLLNDWFDDRERTSEEDKVGSDHSSLGALLTYKLKQWREKHELELYFENGQSQRVKLFLSEAGKQHQ